MKLEKFYRKWPALILVVISLAIIPTIALSKAPTQAPVKTLFKKVDGTGNVMGQTRSVKAKIISRMKVKTAKSSQVIFEDLKPEAKEIGLQNALLEGSIKYEDAKGGNTRFQISWDTISIQSNKVKSLTKKLTKPLKSKFAVPAKTKNVEPGEIITVTGDFNQLTKDFLALKKELDGEIQSPKHLVQKETVREEEAPKRDTSNQTGSNSTGVDGFGDTTGTDGDYSANLLSTSYEDCAPRIAELEGLLYLQHKEVEKNQDGSISKIGECGDAGTTIKATRLTGPLESGCTTIYDFENMKAYPQSKLIAEYNGSEIQVRDCFNDFSSSQDIFADRNECGYQHDFASGKSWAQERLYVVEGSETIYITPCKNSSTAYAHFLTDQTCTPIIDDVSKRYFPMQRVAFEIEGGQMEFASDCKATNDAGFEIQEGFCEPDKYEHDFSVGQSYYRTYDYYVNSQAEAVQIGECGRSPSTNFEHHYNVNSCAPTNDDQALQTQWNATTYIDTPDDGILTIEDCAPTGPATPYIPQNGDLQSVSISNSVNWVVPDRVTTINFDLWAGGGAAAPASSKPGYYGGSSGSFSDLGSGGGGGDFVGQTVKAVYPGTVLPIVIGKGATQPGQNGAYSSFAGTSCRGGYGGAWEMGGDGGGPSAGNAGTTIASFYGQEGDYNAVYKAGSCERGENSTVASGGAPYGTGSVYNSCASGGGGSWGKGGNAGTTGGRGINGGGGGAPGGYGGDGGLTIRFYSTVYKRGDGTIFDPGVQ